MLKGASSDHLLQPKFQEHFIPRASIPSSQMGLLVSSFLPSKRALEGNSISDSSLSPMEPSPDQMDKGTRKYLSLESREDPRE